ncbi:NAD(P)H-binding protein [Streptosporangium sp. G11]|uniref:NAD(P)H-binding protein n=1 Tax=Streptosporangium sp. G11 TaxID=3436926 RepID=UPI003EB6BF61
MILVTGAGGNVGGELVDLLADAGRPVRALARGPWRSRARPGVEVVAADLNRPETLSEALDGVDGVFLLGGFDDMPGVLAAMRAADVGHVVLLSSRSVVGGHADNAVAGMHMTSEAAVRASGIGWTLLRPSGFMSNALEWRAQLRAGDVVRAPFAGVPVAAIDPHDIAAVAAAVLTRADHHHRDYALTGPESGLPADRVRILAEVLGRPLRFEPQSDARARAEMSETVPARYVDAFFRFFVGGEFDDSQVLPTVQEITGRPARSFEQWALAHAEAFK